MNNSSQASQRIAALLDENSFVEIGALVTARSTNFNMGQSKTPSDGVITGYGLIGGRLVYVYSQDSQVLNGSLGEMHAKKITGLYDLALKMGAPVIGMLDSSGIRLQESTDALQAFGEIYRKQAMASGVILQITAVFGTCGGGMAVFPGMTDFTFMESKKGKLFINTPDSLTGNTSEKCNASAAAFQSRESGVVDMTGEENDILKGMRDLISMLPANHEEETVCNECKDDLNRLCEGIQDMVSDGKSVIKEFADNHEFFETKDKYAKEMVTGFAKVNGMTIGCIANRMETLDGSGEAVEKHSMLLTAKGCEKAATFVRFCDAFNIPILSVTNVQGYEASIEAERDLAKATAKLTYALAGATIPKVNLITGKAFGNAYITMNSKAIGADLTIAWDTAQIGVMEASLAAKIIYEGQGAAIIKEKAAEYETLQNSVESAASRGYVDQIINSADTRKYVIGAFEMLFTKRDYLPDRKHGTV